MDTPARLSINGLSLKGRESLYKIISNPIIFEEFYGAYTKAVELAETEPSAELKNILFREQMGRFIGAQNGDFLMQLSDKYSFAHLFLDPVDHTYILNSSGKPITLEEVLGVDAHKLEQEQAAADKAAKQGRIEAAKQEKGILGKIKVLFYEHTDG